MVQFRGGRLPNAGHPRVRLTAANAPRASLLPPPAVDHYSHVPAATWGMDGNDQIGDCTCAEVDHAVKALQVAAGNTEVKSSDAEVVKAYTAITGYDPSRTDAQGNNPTDGGAEMQAVRNYWRTSGFALGGQAHKILLFSEVDHTDQTLLRWCVHQFGEVGLGVNFPASAMDQFDAGKPWTVVRGSQIDGGHAIALVGYDTSWAYVVTWGKVQRVAWSWLTAYLEEAWVQLTVDAVNSATGDDALAQTFHELGEQYTAITGQPNPVPAPSPTPSPAPAPSPAPVAAPFPTAEYAKWKAHPVLERARLVAAIDAWQAAGGH